MTYRVPCLTHELFAGNREVCNQNQLLPPSFGLAQIHIIERYIFSLLLKALKDWPFLDPFIRVSGERRCEFPHSPSTLSRSQVSRLERGVLQRSRLPPILRASLRTSAIGIDITHL